MLHELTWSGLNALLADEKVPFTQSIEAMNCILDDGTISGREGYKNALAGKVDTTGAPPQFLGRHRPTKTAARTVVVVGGKVLVVADPTSETASDGSATDISGGSPVYGSSDLISGAALGKYFYLANDQSSPTWRRIKPDFTLETIISLTKGVAPTYSTAGVSVTQVTGLAAPTVAGGAAKTLQFTDWHTYDNGAAAVCPVGGNTIYNLGADKDATSTRWLQVFATPPSQSAGWGSLKIEIATGAGNFEVVGTLKDGLGGGAPNVIWVDLNALTPATRSAIRRIKFTLLDAAGFWGVYGWMFVPAAPGVGEQHYRATFYNTTTKQESDPTDEVKITFRGEDISIPQYHSVWSNRSTFVDNGTVSADPDVIPFERNYNKDGGLTFPSRAEYAAVATFTITIPTGSLYPNADTVRLWRLTETGWRIVKSVTLTTSATLSVQITDDVGPAALTHELWRANGPPPTCTAMTAYAGRIVTGNGNRMTISDFVPFGQDTDPFPRFAQIPDRTSDGWAFDIAESQREQIQALTSGDAVYIMTQENAFMMEDIAPDAVPTKIVNRGALGSRAHVWADGRLFWAAPDGVYGTTRLDWDEFSKPVRRIYRKWLLATAETVMFYRYRKLWVVTDNRYLRYDFVTGHWTRGTFTHNVKFGRSWENERTVTASFVQQATDSFTDVDNTSIDTHVADTGQSWLKPSWYDAQIGAGNEYTSQVQTNRLWGPNGSGDKYTMRYLNAAPAAANYAVKGTMRQLFADAGAFYLSLVARMDTTVATYYEAGFFSVSSDANQNGWYIYKVVNNVQTQIAFLKATVTVATDYRLRFECTDDYKRLYVNEALILTSGDNAITPKGFAGYRALNQKAVSNHGLAMDDYSVNTISTGSVVEGTQSWFLTDNNYLMRLQETALTDDGATIPDWEYSTGYLGSISMNYVPTMISLGIETMLVDATGRVLATAYNSADASVNRHVDFEPGTSEKGFSVDFLNYQTRVAFKGAHGTVLRTAAVGYDTLDKVGA